MYVQADTKCKQQEIIQTGELGETGPAVSIGRIYQLIVGLASPWLFMVSRDRGVLPLHACDEAREGIDPIYPSGIKQSIVTLYLNLPPIWRNV